MSHILDDNKIKENLKSLDGWVIKNNLLYKKFSFKTFMNAFSFMNIIADQSEKVDHHPKLINEYNTVEIELYTHSLDGITKKDFSLAGFMDNIYELAGKCTVIIATHRVATLKNCDKIYDINNGKIEEIDGNKN